ncbi:TetR/AcrR family transcriptional regulator [Aegicerativicinus sediminis]|uniref:TetR/AcrR family transcriptional regulator n=1 Tax=Aegicerativicinus sediminis TaxID=2893202 RepID=UPI001E57E04A|nr:TetR/AcrR family transcriptional regulator [Aegicerativicinus sediminis]
MKEDYIQSGRVNQKLETREKIIESAQYFLKSGHNVNLDEIANRAGVSRATIYRYYSNVEVLLHEAGLDLSVLPPETIITDLGEVDINETILGIQDYYNDLALDNETAFRKYLGIAIASNDAKNKRGARRKKTLGLAFKNLDLPKEDKVKLIDLFTVLMGIEPIIVTKDVCGLNNQQSKEVLKLGIDLILKALNLPKK